MATNKEKDKVDVAFGMYEHVYVTLNNTKMRQSNTHSVGDPNRVEHDLTEREKEQLALLRSKLHMELANKLNSTLAESSASSDRLGTKLFWLNIVAAAFTLVLAISALIELTQ